MRLENTIEQFHQDITEIFNQSFERSSKLNKAIRSAITSGKIPDLSNINISNVPQFISGEPKGISSDNKKKKEVKEKSKNKKSFFSRKK